MIVRRNDHVGEEVPQGAQTLVTEATQQLIRHVAIEMGERVQAHRCDSNLDDAAIPLRADALGEAVTHQSIGQSRHVRVPGDHPVGDLAACETGRTSSSQDSEDVVLVGRQARVRSQVPRPRIQGSICRNLKCDKHFRLD